MALAEALMFHLIGELLVGMLTRLIACVLLFPIWLAVATPFILIAAPFHQGGIRGGYRVAIRAYDWTCLVV
jgi:hypothetical protein